MNTITSLPASDLALSIDRVKHAMATDQARPILAGMHFEIGPARLRLAAADNYRIAWADIGLEPVEDRERSFTIARSDVLFLLRWLRAYKGRDRNGLVPTLVTLTVSEERLEVVIGRPDTVLRKIAPVLSFWLVDGQFPNYAALIPEKAETPTVALNVRYLEDVGKAMRAVASAGIVKLYVTDPLAPVLIEAYDCDGGEIIMPFKTAEFAKLRQAQPPAAYPAESPAAVEA
jgi:DNA polymerase III sliding clamp (beta) subunit (PCNA family)